MPNVTIAAGFRNVGLVSPKSSKFVIVGTFCPQGKDVPH